MRTVLPDPPPAEFEALLERRRRAGADRHDEVWDGVVHMVPAPSGAHAELEWQLAALLRPRAAAAGLIATGPFNLGVAEDYRVPDGGLHRTRPEGTWHPTVAVVVEILSPGDETWDKLPFYAAHAVNELLILDPDERTVQWRALDASGEYQFIERSGLIELSARELSGAIDWPS